MIRLNDFIKLPVDNTIIIKAMKQAIDNTSVGLNNLRYRPLTIILDCKIRGYIGEMALRKWFSNYNIDFVSSDFLDDDTNIDIDLLYRGINRSYNFEVKTSLVPDFYRNMIGVIQRADIKIIKRTENIESLSGDVHIQIYYDFLRKQRDQELRLLRQNFINEDYLYTNMRLKEYIDNTYFVAWIDKPTLVKYINNQYRKTWTFPYAKRDFWRCPLSDLAKKPIELINYTKQL